MVMVRAARRKVGNQKVPDRINRIYLPTNFDSKRERNTPVVYVRRKRVKTKYNHRTVRVNKIFLTAFLRGYSIFASKNVILSKRRMSRMK